MRKLNNQTLELNERVERAKISAHKLIIQRTILEMNQRLNSLRIPTQFELRDMYIYLIENDAESNIINWRTYPSIEVNMTIYTHDRDTRKQRKIPKFSYESIMILQKYHN